MVGFNSFKNKLNKRITNRWHVTDFSQEEQYDVSTKVIATYEECLENGMNEIDSFKMALSDLDKYAPIEKGIKPKDSLKLRIFSWIMISILFGLQVVFINLDNLNYLGHFKLSKGIGYILSNIYAVNIAYILIWLLALEIPVLYYKETHGYSYSNIIEELSMVIIIQFIPFLLNINHLNNYVLFYTFTFYNYLLMTPVSLLAIYFKRTIKHKKFLPKDIFVGIVGIFTIILILINYIGFNSRTINVILAVLISFLMIVTMCLFILESKKVCTLKDNKVKNIIIISLCILFMFILKETDYWIARKADLLSINDYLLNDYSKLFGDGAFSKFLISQIFVFSWVPEGLIFIIIFILICLCLHTNKQYKSINYLSSAYSIFTFLYIFRMLLRIDTVYTNDLDFEGLDFITSHLIYLDKQIFNSFSLASISFTLILILTGYIFINLLNRNAKNEVELLDSNVMVKHNNENKSLLSWNIINIFFIVLWCVNKITYIDKIKTNLSLTSFYNIIFISSGLLNIVSIICFMISTILVVISSYIYFRHNKKIFNLKTFNIFIISYILHTIIMTLTVFGVL